MSIEPFEIPSFTPAQLETLRSRLSQTIYPQELNLADNNWNYGAPSQAVKPLVEEWRDSYNWEEARAEMNQWHHYKITLEDELKVHFIHEPSKQPEAIPLLLLHGWPSTFYEFHKVINPLRDAINGGQAYHVIVPSLPGYGFSSPPTTPGFGVAKMGDTLHQMMLALGYEKYVVSGTDWGSTIARYMAGAHDTHCSAMHITMFISGPPWPNFHNLIHHPFRVLRFLLAILLGFDRVYGQGQFKSPGNNFADIMRNKDAGYRAIQGTKPYTLAFGLTDSPVGLLAWMLEKYHSWTYHPSDNELKTAVLPCTVSSKEFLTQVSIYWLTNTMSSSIRLYYEFLDQMDIMMQHYSTPVRVPIGVSNFKGELARIPQDWMKLSGDLQFYSEHSIGGHFSALEVPELLIADIQNWGKKVASSVKK